MTLRLLTLPALMLLTAGCVMDKAPVTDQPAATPCGAERHEALVGQAWDPALLPQQEAPVRVLRPDDMMTMDHMPNRLNIHLDADDRVSALRCG